VTFALLFPGQASQEIGMGVTLRGATAEADRIFRLADEITELPIGELCAHGPLAELTRTHVAQVAVVATSLAAAAVLEQRLPGLQGLSGWVGVLGHSVGEITAMCVAGTFDAETALRLVAERGRLMERDSSSCDGAMVAVLGLTAQELAPLCAEASSSSGGIVQVANLNAPGQVVMSGDRAAIAAASALATRAGARRVLPLNVGGPFHSVYMQNAARDFVATAARTPLATPQIPIVLNTTAEPTTDVEALREELSAQISLPVRWEESIHRLSALGCDTFVELGAGQVLSGLVKRIAPGARTIAAGTPDAVDGVVELLVKTGAAS